MHYMRCEDGEEDLQRRIHGDVVDADDAEVACNMVMFPLNLFLKHQSAGKVPHGRVMTHGQRAPLSIDR
jgi:hypothetical protein